jgi:hypothetical protein
VSLAQMKWPNSWTEIKTPKTKIQANTVTKTILHYIFTR